MRQVYMVLSPRSLAYARGALQSLLSHSVEDLNLHLVTDSAADVRELQEAVTALSPEARHHWSVTGEEELNDAEARLFAGLPHLRAFRKGHPCWRKVTDPLLLSEPETNAELVLLDPDVFFPNRFRFEPTPARGVALMWQQPNCLLPPPVVRAAMEASIPLARHVDIGVSHWRAGSDLGWIDWMLSKLANGQPLPRMMHVEAIVWAAIAMREGGGYLDPGLWVCWHRTQTKRVRLKLGRGGKAILATEPWATMKCFHAGGEAKWWVPEAVASRTGPIADVIADSQLKPFVELTPTRYGCEQSLKGALRGLGYYRVFGARAS